MLEVLYTFFGKINLNLDTFYYKKLFYVESCVAYLTSYLFRVPFLLWPFPLVLWLLMDLKLTLS